jgi:hypothetical protein
MMEIVFWGGGMRSRTVGRYWKVLCRKCWECGADPADTLQRSFNSYCVMRTVCLCSSSATPRVVDLIGLPS